MRREKERERERERKRERERGKITNLLALASSRIQ